MGGTQRVVCVCSRGLGVECGYVCLGMMFFLLEFVRFFLFGVEIVVFGFVFLFCIFCFIDFFYLVECVQ